MLANWGELDGVRILPESRIRAGMELQSLEFDMIYHIRCVARVGLSPRPATGPLAGPDAIGHVGGGGSFGYSDPGRRLGIAFAKNYFTYETGTVVARVGGPPPPRAASCDHCGSRVRRPGPRALRTCATWENGHDEEDDDPGDRLGDLVVWPRPGCPVAVRGTITGRVTSDQGQMRGSASPLTIWIAGSGTPSSPRNGQYIVPQALPGRYEMMAVEPGHDSARVSVQLGPGESRTADLALKMRPSAAKPPLTRGDEGPAARESHAASTVYFNTLDELYPAGPAKALLRENCIGCHRDDLGSMHYTKQAFVIGIEKMTETGPANNHYSLALGRTPISRQQKEMVAEYLVKHFGPGMPDKKLREEPFIVDEEIASKSIYVSYDIPDDLPFPSMGNTIGGHMVDGVIAQLAPETRHHLQAAAISPVDGHVWYSSRASSSVLGLDPKELDPARRWKNHPIKGEPYVHPTGIAVDKRGRVYWAEARGSRLGELDPVTGKQIRYALPAQAGAMLQVIVDKDREHRVQPHLGRLLREDGGECPAGCTCIRPRRLTTASTDWTSTRRATCGARAGRKAPSASGTCRLNR